ncbi:class I poly(R)-hydroxyalkanoic acid synthase [Oceanisphaera psychrotolerans]|uniref:Class I poly(R)-hydroxyalkanoic acid synthase n=1 Tax=Oceanisphaera psychrotolerans TaxID=1414654 RepID=A0A1J4QGK7_9GAMM|nr:class I poly(R)-hydroxyalkanoic acid synthase [Oceanisphaera psychrotolerans]OIN13098.1 class I poly(R)-hydroxyalkanoic acid synthase [Oceanisphaera psychrotolerans]
MQQDMFNGTDPMHQFFQWNETMWSEMQRSRLGDNPVSQALSDVNAEDLKVFYQAVSTNPMRLLDMQMQWWQGQLAICQNSMIKTLDNSTESLVADPPGDRRFKHQSWKDDPHFDFMRQSYLHFAKSLADMLEVIEGVPESVRQRLSFTFRQTINALAPTNFIWSNPELLQRTLQEKGANLVKGVELFQEDLAASADLLKIRMTRQAAFTLGKDLATTPGEVVFRNDIFELIQYTASTETVHQTPLLVIPPFINKFYILDLKEQNSLVSWLRDQGHTVFIMSWRNPSKAQASTGFQDLIHSGTMEAIRVIEQITAEKEVNAIGYCIGGTLLASTMALYAARRMKPRVKSATFLTTLLDFTQPGEVGVFINDPVVSAIEQMSEAQGFFDGRQMAVTFSLLRENSLYWNYYIDNYLKGEEPSDFDILYWNSDSTNLSATCASFLLRELYLNNRLSQPGQVKVGNFGIDLGKVKTPSYFLSTKEDHIALWDATFSGSRLLGADTTLVLGESGHVAGVVNPPHKNKYGYWLSDADYDNAEQWLASAKREAGSWWTHWQQWVSPYLGDKTVPARAPGSDAFPSLMPAPGQYVQQTLPVEE